MNRFATLIAFVALASPGAAQAPSLQLGAPAGRGGAPLEITAREGIEWDRAGQRYIARGAARVAQGDRAVAAERLIAFYREGQGSTQIYRYQAQGGVRVTSATQTVQADQATYDVGNGLLVLSGRNLRITTPNEQVTANDMFEYSENARRAVARGDATVISREGRRVRAEVLVVYLLAPGEQIPQRANAPGQAQPQRPRAPAAAPAATTLPGVPGEQRVRRVEAFDGVVISTQTDNVTGDRAVYDAIEGMAVVAGNVRITRGQNVLAGDYAEVDLNTGVARLLPRPPNQVVQPGSDGRVRGLFVPGEGQNLPGLPGTTQPPARRP